MKRRRLPSALSLLTLGGLASATALGQQARAPSVGQQAKAPSVEQQAKAPPVRLSEMGFSIPMTPTTQRAVLRVRVPEALYRGVRRADLGDVRVFNDDGEAVPHTLRTLDAPLEVDRGDTALPLFPLHAEGAELPPLEGLRIAVDHANDRTQIDLRTLLAPESSPDAGIVHMVTGYLLDARDLAAPIDALRVDMADAPSDYVLPVVVESSNDLARFHRVDARGTLADLDYASAHIHQGRLELPGTSAPYLRLRPEGDAAWPAEVIAVHAELTKGRAAAARVTSNATGVERASEPGVYDFDLGGYLPVDQVQVRLPHDNTLVQATLSSSPTADDDGEEVFAGTLYRIFDEGRRLESPALDVARRVHRYWVLRVDSRGGGLAGATPRLLLSRHPDQLLFIARGSPPFHLAYGHHAAGPTGFPANEVIDLMRGADRAEDRDDVRLGPPEARAGRAALTPPPPPPPYLHYLLWAVLVAGALGLAWTAVRMLRQSE